MEPVIYNSETAEIWKNLSDDDKNIKISEKIFKIEAGYLPFLDDSLDGPIKEKPGILCDCNRKEINYLNWEGFGKIAKEFEHYNLGYADGNYVVFFGMDYYESNHYGAVTPWDAIAGAFFIENGIDLKK